MDPGDTQIGREWRPGTPWTSSSGPRKSLVFEAEVGGRMATLKTGEGDRKATLKVGVGDRMATLKGLGNRWFLNRGRGPDGHSQSVQSKTLIIETKTHSKKSAIPDSLGAVSNNLWRRMV